MSILYKKRAEDIREVYPMACNTVKRVKNRRKKRNNKFVEERKIFGNRGRRYFRRR